MVLVFDYYEKMVQLSSDFIMSTEWQTIVKQTEALMLKYVLS